MAASRTIERAASSVPVTDLGAMTADVAPALDSAWRELLIGSSFIGGVAVERFEEDWSHYCGVSHAVGVANGTDAIELTLRGLGIGPGDEVILPANTFIATAEAVVLAGATPRFVDVDPKTLLVTPETIAAGIGGRTAGVIVVGLYGNVPAMDQIVRLTDARGLALIEDAAQAHGSTWLGQRVGSFGVAGCFSFYPGKNLGAFGDAGAVVTNDPTLDAAVRSLANHGRSPRGAHIHKVVGRNSRLDALQAGVLSAKLPMLDRWNSARESAMSVYRAMLGPDVQMVMILDGASSTYHQNVVRVGRRDEVRAALLAQRIETGIHYPIPCHHQEPYRRFATDPLPVTERAAEEIVSLPLFPHITVEQIEYVSANLNQIAGRLCAHVA